MYIPMEEGEEMVMKVHRHWIFIALRVAGLIVMLLAPWLFVAVLQRLGIITLGTVSLPSYVVLWALWGLILWALFWQFWTTYYMDIWVVTNRRIIDIDYRRLFDRDIAILRLDRVQDVTTRIVGILGTLLHYGAVRMQSAGSDKAFIIDQIANPETLRDAIVSAVGKEAERLSDHHHPGV